MADADILLRLGLALAIGSLLGLERGWQGRSESEGGRVAGIRTFALTGLLGGVGGWLGELASPLVPAFGLLALGALLAVGYRAQLREDGDLGVTTEVALLLTFALGAAASLGAPAPAAAAAVVATLLLSRKRLLHASLERIERLELDALLKLALLSVVAPPLLPDRGYGPGGVLNPSELWWAVVIVAGLSFLGYVAMRLVGARLGMLATGVFGGLASSTSTTLALARVAASRRALAGPAAAGIAVAGAVTFLRILVLVAVFEPRLLAPLSVPMAAMAAVGLAGSAALHRLQRGGEAGEEGIEGIANPLALGAALGFGAILAAVLVAVQVLRDLLGTEGVHLAAAISGLTDVDALTISVSRLVGGELPAADGAVAVFVAAAVNTAVKAGIALIVGGRAVGLRVLAVHGAAVLAGGAALLAGGAAWPAIGWEGGG